MESGHSSDWMPRLLSPRSGLPSSKWGPRWRPTPCWSAKASRPLLVITSGFGDGLRIGYQNRPQLFARHIVLPEMLYARVVEIEERVDAQGVVVIPLNERQAERDLQAAYDQGLRSVAIVLMHGYRFHQHELRLATLAERIGFTQISVSHRVSPLIKLIARGDTTVVDAYLSPILRRYVDRMAGQLGSGEKQGPDCCLCSPTAA